MYCMGCGENTNGVIHDCPNSFDKLHLKFRQETRLVRFLEFLWDQVPFASAIIINVLLLAHSNWSFPEKMTESICMGFVIAELLRKKP